MKKIKIIHQELTVDPENDELHGDLLLIAEIMNNEVTGTYSVVVHNWLYYFGVHPNRYWLIQN